MRRGFWSAAAATVAAMGILIALGVWQVERLQWKNRLLAGIAAAEKAVPVELPPQGTPPLFERVSVTGTLRSERAALFGAEVRDGRLGAQEIELLDRAAGKPVLVDLGWVPTEPAPPPPETGRHVVVGYVRQGETPNFLSAADDLVGRHFYTMEPQAMGLSLGAADAAPFVVVAMGVAPGPGAPVPAETLPRPPNNHLQYAFTWFGLAGALLAIFTGWVRGKAESEGKGYQPP